MILEVVFYLARMVELADTLDLGSSAYAWGFKSPFSHFINSDRFEHGDGSLIVVSLLIR